MIDSFFKDKIPKSQLDEMKKHLDFNPKRIESYADAFYDAYRCGVIHETRIKSYGVIDGLDPPNYFIWDGNRLKLDPGKFCDKLKQFFNQYVKKLLLNEEPLVNNFKTRLEYIVKLEI